MPNIPLNIYPRQTPLGRTAHGQEVFIDDKWRDLIFQIIRRLGGESNLSVSDIQALANAGSGEAVAAEAMSLVQDAFLLGHAVAGGAAATESDIANSDDVREAGFWSPLTETIDEAAPELIFHDDGSPIMVWTPT